MAERVTLHEVGPRDGLQNEADAISVPEKLALISALADAGLKRIEVGSFVSPKWVPQMANTDLVMAKLSPLYKGQYDVLIPNKKGWEVFQAAEKSGDYGIAVFVSASEGFSRANLNCSIDESLQRVVPVVDAAVAADIPVRGYISCVTDCPFEGPISPDAVLNVALKLHALAPMQLSLGETIGMGTPNTVEAMLKKLLNEFPADRLAGHFHDTNMQAIGNIEAALGLGLRAFDSAVGGLGGCPYAPGAPGNVATEAVVAYLHRAGFETGVNLTALKRAAGIAHDIRRRSRAATQP